MLNTEHFVLLAGNPAKWDEETRRLPDRGESLCALQVDQHRRGRRSASLTWSIYGWYIRAGSNLESPEVLAHTRERGGPLDGSFEAALEWGTAWADADPENREFYASVSLLRDHKGETCYPW